LLNVPGLLRYARGMEQLVDELQRPLREVRVSVTDRCNLRCPYCMPKEVFGAGFHFLAREDQLSFEEIARVTTVLARLGVTKVRLTGGEPLLRAKLEHLVAMLSAVDGIDELALTTNGLALAPRAQRLRDAGLTRVTVSLDSLDDATFGWMNGLGVSTPRVLAGIEAAACSGLDPVKVNMVVRRGVNDRGVVAMAGRFRHTGVTLRFIEYMDVGATNRWMPSEVLPAAEILALIEEHWPLEPLEPARADEVASRYRYRDGGGEVGVVASVTEPFCRGCTRARLTSDGHLHTCLFSAGGHDLRKALRDGISEAELERMISAVWSARRDRYSELRASLDVPAAKPEMSYIGG
jgi:GTP 3',8-cyclase